MILNRKFHNFFKIISLHIVLVFTDLIDARFFTKNLFGAAITDEFDNPSSGGTTELTVEKLIQSIKKEKEKPDIKRDEDAILRDADLRDTEYFIDEGRAGDVTTEEITTFGTIRPVKPTENDPREGICKRYLKDTDHVEVSTTNIREIFTGHYAFNYSKCCFDKHKECRKLWYFTPVLQYYDTKQKWREIDVCCKGYERDRRSMFDTKGRLLCTPVCEKTCVKSTCTSPNNCTCVLGYKKVEGNNTVCIPSCKKNCGGKSRGECVAPETCLCKRGFIYKKEELNTCVSHCRKPCINSVCNGPSTCRCLPGYKRDVNDRYKCVPVCKEGCAHGDCVAPNKCVCHKGYNLVGGNCWTLCDHFCGYNGTCVDTGAPIKCKCDPGYKYDDRIRECMPHCDNCSAGGTCIYPNKCRCFRGFLPTKDGGCVFVCSFECGLGRCVGRDKCLCPKGYIFNKTAVGPKCVPFCQGCELGECIAPNMCQCPRGYVYHVPKEGEDRRIRCIPTVKQFRYYDNKICKGIYDERQRRKEQEIKKKQTQIAKKKWDEQRRSKKKEFQQKQHEKKIKQETDKKVKARRKEDKKEWLIKQRKANEAKLIKERLQDEKIRRMYVEYKDELEKKKPTVTWKNFARVAVASMFFGPFGIIFW